MASLGLSSINSSSVDAAASDLAAFIPTMDETSMTDNLLFQQKLQTLTLMVEFNSNATKAYADCCRKCIANFT